MKKKTAFIGLVTGLCVLSSIPAFASGWQKDTVGWWYGTNENNTTWYNSGWQWVDGNNDGIAESYYFNSNGYIAVNTTVDGYTVNNDGAWTVNGIVQTKQVSLTDTKTSTSQKDISQMTNEELAKWFQDQSGTGLSGVGSGTGEKVNLNGGSTEGTETKEKTGSELFEHKGVGGSTGSKVDVTGGSQTSGGTSGGTRNGNQKPRFDTGGTLTLDPEAAARAHMY